MVAKQGDGKMVTLQAGTVNTVKVHGMTFLVTATNGGDFTEFNIPVTLTLGRGTTRSRRPPRSTRSRRASRRRSRSSGFESTTLQFDKAVKLKVLVTPVPGEHTASNNSQTYQVIFSL